MTQNLQSKIKFYQNLALFFVLAAACMIFTVDPAMAQTAPFDTLCTKVYQAWDRGKKIVYIIGGIGALALGVLAFFGRFKWTTFFALVGGIFVIAIFGQIITYIAQGTSDTGAQISSC